MTIIIIIQYNNHTSTHTTAPSIELRKLHNRNLERRLDRKNHNNVYVYMPCTQFAETRTQNAISPLPSSILKKLEILVIFCHWSKIYQFFSNNWFSYLGKGTFFLLLTLRGWVGEKRRSQCRVRALPIYFAGHSRLLLVLGRFGVVQYLGALIYYPSRIISNFFIVISVRSPSFLPCRWCLLFTYLYPGVQFAGQSSFVMKWIIIGKKISVVVYQIKIYRIDDGKCENVVRWRFLLPVLRRPGVEWKILFLFCAKIF